MHSHRLFAVAKVVAGVAGGLVAAAVAASGAGAAAVETGPLVVPVPDARDLPATATSWPFLAAKQNLRPLDLATFGYVETESLISGKGRVFDWTKDGRVGLLPAAPQPFVNRILVRKPADKARFSGVVVVEVMNDARSADWPILWGYVHDTLMRNGHAWVGVTLPRSTIGLKKFDPQRYAMVSYAPTEPLGCKTADDSMEEGLRFEFAAQVGALLKSASPASPLAGYGVKTLVMTSQGVETTTYAVALQHLLRLPSGKPVYDGFLIKSTSGLGKLNHCGETVPITDPRAQLRGVGVPVISVVAQGEAVAALPVRREDSDSKADPYRLYEVTGASHLDRYPYEALPSMEDAKRAGSVQGTPEWPFNARCVPEIQLSSLRVLSYVFDSSLVNLERWIKDGAPPPRAERLAIKTGGKEPEVITDPYGAGRGGVRSVFVDAPVAAYTMGSPGPGNCPEFGSVAPFSWPYLQSLYGSPAAYRAKALPMVDAMAAQRWLTPDDATQLRREISAPPAPPQLATRK